MHSKLLVHPRLLSLRVNLCKPEAFGLFNITLLIGRTTLFWTAIMLLSCSHCHF